MRVWPLRDCTSRAVGVSKREIGERGGGGSPGENEEAIRVGQSFIHTGSRQKVLLSSRDSSLRARPNIPSFDMLVKRLDTPTPLNRGQDPLGIVPPQLRIRAFPDGMTGDHDQMSQPCHLFRPLDRVLYTPHRTRLSGTEPRAGV